MASSVSAYMNLPPPVESSAYQSHIADILDTAEKSAVSSSNIAADEAKAHMQSSNICVSVDDTWQRRGFSSKNGVVTALTVMGKDQGSKIIDTEVLSTFCPTCVQRDSNENTKLSSSIARSHECTRNHEGSAGKMEAEGAVEIYQRSEENFGLKYTEYLGDGVTKAIHAVSTSGVYGSLKISKLECTGHIQKRMFKALRDVVDDHKNKRFVVNSAGQWLKSKQLVNRARGEKVYTGIGGAGRLTTKAMKGIQGHYGAAVRENSSLADMKRAIWSIFYHRSGQHSDCPDWCASHTGDMEKANRHRLTHYLCVLIKPVFERLSSDDLLTKYLHGGAQNANEAFHHTLWARCPEEKFAGPKQIRLATAIATLTFNDGEQSLAPAFMQMGITLGRYHLQYAKRADYQRVADASRAVSAKNKKSRQDRQSSTTRSNIDNANYLAGAF